MSAPDLVILTGFLGSGKTTLLKRLIERARPDQLAVIVNEFADVGIDQRLLGLREDDLVLTGGCICCAVRDELGATVRRLLARRAEGAIPAFQSLIIETTGLADPGVIVNGLVGEADIAAGVRSLTVVATLDAVHGAAQIANEPEAERQLTLADLLVLTKTLLAKDADLETVRALASSWNPVAPIIDGDGDEVAGALLGRLSKRPRRLWNCDEVATHGEGVVAVRLAADLPVRLDALTLWVHDLMSAYGPNLLRLKGLAAVAGLADPVAVHGVAGVAYPALQLPREGADGIGVELVLIGRGLRRDEITSSFRGLLAG